jgi:spiro-SPASM protein
MPAESFAALLGGIEGFAGDAVIGISLWGEPSLHPDIFSLISETLSRPSLDLVIETSGIGWDQALFQKVRSSLSRAPTWIVSLDASQQAVYRTLRGEGFAEALRTAEALLELFPGSAWVQAVRMKENEEDLEAFFKGWKSRTEDHGASSAVIIQKYDSFCGLLPDRTVADLSPVKRFPCWHLMRDLPILLDGTVPLCREELKAERSLGNAFAEQLAVIWERGAEVHRSHLRKEYPGPCARCDEYYTYNF